MKQHLVRIVLGLVIVLFFIGHAAKFYEVGIVSQLDHIVFDARLKVTMPGGIDERIVILDIDEKSLQEVGRWPWPRDVMARLMTKLFDQYQVAIVAFDVVFAEPDYSSGIKKLDELAARDLRQVPAFVEAYEKLRPELDNDGLFAKAIKGRPVVLGYYLNSDKGAKKLGAIPEPVFPKGHLRQPQHLRSRPGKATAATCRSSRKARQAAATSTHGSISTASCAGCR